METPPPQRGRGENAKLKSTSPSGQCMIAGLTTEPFYINKLFVENKQKKYAAYKNNPLKPSVEFKKDLPAILSALSNYYIGIHHTASGCERQGYVDYWKNIHFVTLAEFSMISWIILLGIVPVMLLNCNKVTPLLISTNYHVHATSFHLITLSEPKV